MDVVNFIEYHYILILDKYLVLMHSIFLSIVFINSYEYFIYLDLFEVEKSTILNNLLSIIQLIL